MALYIIYIIFFISLFHRGSRGTCAYIDVLFATLIPMSSTRVTRLLLEVGNTSSPLGREVCWRAGGEDIQYQLYAQHCDTGNILSSSTYARQVAEFISAKTRIERCYCGFGCASRKGADRSGHTFVYRKISLSSAVA